MVVDGSSKSSCDTSSPPRLFSGPAFEMPCMVWYTYFEAGAFQKVRVPSIQKRKHFSTACENVASCSTYQNLLDSRRRHHRGIKTLRKMRPDLQPTQLLRAHNTRALATTSLLSSTKCLSPITSSTMPLAASPHLTASLTTLSTRKLCRECRRPQTLSGQSKQFRPQLRERR